MEIKVGKFYKTRDGKKARIYATDGYFPIHGAVKEELGWLSYKWDADGSFNCQSGESRYDIISEWEEPKPRLRAWIHGDGTVKLGSGISIEYSPKLGPPKRAPWLDEPE